MGDGMVDREKVIKGLECCWDAQSGWKDARYVCPTCPYTDNGIPCETLAPLMEDALALLKAQEAVEPVQDIVGDALFWVCGKCGHDIKNSDWYCANCGRAVKWE